MRRSTRLWLAMLLVPKVAANMVNAHLASAMCLTARRSALRGNRSAKAHGPRNIANAHLVNDWPTLREARRVQKLIVFMPAPNDTNARRRCAAQMRVAEPCALKQCV